MSSVTQQGIAERETRLAGALYLLTVPCGLFAELAVRARLRAEDAATTALNIAQHQLLYRVGEAADLVMLACYIAVTVLLYRMFAPAGRSLALIAACFSLIGIAVLAVAGVLHLIPEMTRDIDPKLALDLHGALYGISLFFFGMYCLMIGWLCLVSRQVPRLVGALMIVGGLTHSVTRLVWIVAPQLLAFVPRPVNMLPLLGEVALALWLLLGRRRLRRA